MNFFLQYLKDYFKQISIPRFLLTSIFIGLLIALNFHFHLEKNIRNLSSPWLSLLLFFGLYFFIFVFTYFIQFYANSQIRLLNQSQWLLTGTLATFLFGLKMISWNFTGLYSQILPYPWSKMADILLELPLKMLFLVGILWIIWKRNQYPAPFAGLSLKGLRPGPYLVACLFVVPLVAWASTNASFLHSYPKFHRVEFIEAYTNHGWIWKWLFEISYGLDFISIEIFFRGFLVLAFLRFAGIHSILPMAAFYCSIQFGKPPAECISSYFGGMILGLLAYRTQSIVGGLAIHWWIAYLMELGGWLGHQYFNSR